MASLKYRKYYTRGDTLPLEEDERNEFKGHRNLCKEEIPLWALESKHEKGSRRPISRNINAFLNSAIGGCIFLGILDNGKIHGLGMTRLQRDHFLKSTKDLMQRYKPKVLPHQYSVHFTPVIDPACSQQEIINILDFVDKEESSQEDKERSHLLRTNKICWCDKDAMAVLNSGKAQPHFVVEIRIKAWDPYDPLNVTVGQDKELKIQPYYTSEEGRVYFRRHASVLQYSIQSIIQITKQEVKDLYEAEIQKLKEEIEDLELKTVMEEEIEDL